MTNKAEPENDKAFWEWYGNGEGLGVHSRTALKAAFNVGVQAALQSHREAIAAKARVTVKEYSRLHEELAKKDAALKACVEALRTCSENIDYEMFYDKDAVAAAIAQAKESGAPAAPILDHASIEGMDETAGLPPILKKQAS